jgi:phasin family protein
MLTAAEILVSSAARAISVGVGLSLDDAKRDEQARTARAATDEAAKVGEQAARAGADMARRGAETARDAMQSGVEMATQGFQRMTDQVTRSFGLAGPQTEELARRSSENVQAVSQAGQILARGAQNVSREWFGLVQEGWRRNMDAMNRLARCQSVQDFVAIQSELMRDGLRQAIETNKRVAELSVRIAEEAAGVIEAQTNANADRPRRAAH